MTPAFSVFLFACKFFRSTLLLFLDLSPGMGNVPDRFRQRGRNRRGLTLKRQKQLVPQMFRPQLTLSKATRSIGATSHCANLPEPRSFSYRSLEVSTRRTSAKAGLEQGRRRSAT